MAEQIIIRSSIKGARELRDFIRKTANRIKNPRRAFNACALWAASRTKKYFVDPRLRRMDGLNWPDKSRKWAEWQGQIGKGKPLFHTGHLMRSIQSSADGRGFAYGTNLKYAHVHNVGADRPRTITIYLREQPGGGERLTEPDDPCGEKRLVEVQPRKRTFLGQPPERFIKRWQDILLNFFIEGNTK